MAWYAGLQHAIASLDLGGFVVRSGFTEHQLVGRLPLGHLENLEHAGRQELVAESEPGVASEPVWVG